MTRVPIMSQQHHHHRPAMLRRADEHVDEDGRKQHAYADPVGNQDRACRRKAQHKLATGVDFRRAPDEPGIVDHGQEQAEEKRDKQQDQVAAGQPAPGKGIVQRHAGDRSKDGDYQDELELLVGEPGFRRDGSRFERNAQQDRDCNHRHREERLAARYVAVMPGVEADDDQEDGSRQGQPNGGGVDVSSGHRDASFCGRKRSGGRIPQDGGLRQLVSTQNPSPRAPSLRR